MRFLRRTSSRTPRVAFLVVLLLLTLGLAGLLAHQAQDAGRSHRAALEETLRDYASFAAWQFARRVQAEVATAVHQTLHPFFMEGSHTVPRPELPGLAEFEALHRPGSVACGALGRIETYFRLDPATGALATNGRPLPEPVAAWLAGVVVEAVAGAGAESPVREAVVFGAVDGREWAAGYAVGGRPVGVRGFVALASEFRFICEDAFRAAALLPPSRTDGAPNDSLLSVTLSTPAGGLVCGSRVQYASDFAGADTMAVAQGGLVVAATLRPEAAGSLLIGGLPASRLPLLLGLLLLATGLVVAAIIQLRREYELVRLREDFVSGVSHELRTPLAQIRMFVETLRLGRVRSEAERRRSLAVIDREARRLGHLVENVLRMSGSRRAATRVAAEPTALAPLVREVVEAFEPLASAREVRLEVIAEPGVVAPVDRGALRQMLLNLLDNAVKYGPAHQTVKVAVSAGDGVARIRVDDQGPGIPARDRERVWQSFSRLDRDVDLGVGGTGIGLAVVRELAWLHGGTARAEESPGGGARFVLELPGAWTRVDDGAAGVGAGPADGAA